MEQRSAGNRDGATGAPDDVAFTGGAMYARRAGRFKLRERGERDAVLSTRQPYYFGVLVLVITSAILRQPLLFISALLILAVIAIPEIWYRYGLSALTVERRPETRRAVFGDTTEVSLVVENRKLLPLPALEISDDFPDSLPVVGMRLKPSAKQETAVLTNVLALWAYQRVRRRYRLSAIARGAYRFGPMTLRASDPFGILTRETTIDAPAVLLVHPLVAPLERFGLPSHAPFGERKSPRRLLEDPLRVSGIRAYEPGDEPRRIHWKATARTGMLQSRIYEPATRHTLAIFVEIRTFARALIGYDPQLVELAVTTAASVAMWGLDQGYAVGLYSNGTLAMPELDSEHARATPPRGATPSTPESADLPVARAPIAASLRLRVPPSSHIEQGTKLLDGLARLLPYYGLPMSEIIASEAARLPLGASVVCIGAEPAMDVPLILALRQLRSRGHTTTLLLTRSDTEGVTELDGALHLAGLPIHFVGGRQRWQELEADILGPNVDRHASRLRSGTTTRRDSSRAEAGAQGDSNNAQTSTNTTEQGGTGGTDQRASGWRTSRPLVVE